MGSTHRFPKSPKQRCRSTPRRSCPRAGPTSIVTTVGRFFIALQGIFEGHFEDGILVRAKVGDVYSEPIAKMHRGHNPHDTIPCLCAAFCVTRPGPRPRDQRGSGLLSWN
jgi:hypothetical protein